jgi:ABC-type nitrate/sulfonate/bicarbonate transport system ATPase subunit
MSEGLTARGLTVRFPGRETPVLDRIHLDLQPGSFTAVLGASGSGKSTLLNCFAGLLAPTDGEVSRDGAPIVGPSPARGVVFQRDILFPWMTVERNIAFALRAAGVARAQRTQRIGALLRAVRLEDEVRERMPHELSGGMRQRVSLARTLAGRPRALLMDEPFGALDAFTRLRMQDLVTDIWEREQTTVLFVTHDVDEAIRLADRILVLGRAGRIEAAVENPLPRPRPAAELAGFADYPALRATLHHALDTDPGGERTLAPDFLTEAI